MSPNALGQLTPHPPDARYLRAALHLLAAYCTANLLFPTDGVNAGRVVVLGLLAASILMFASFAAAQRSLSRHRTNSSVALVLLLTCSVVTLFRALSLEPTVLISIIFNPVVGVVVWAIPLIALVVTSQYALEIVLTTARVHAIVSTPFSIITVGYALTHSTPLDYFDTWAQVGPMLAYGTPLLLLSRRVKGRQWLLFFLIFSLSIAADFLNGSRWLTAIGLIYAIAILGSARAGALGNFLKLLFALAIVITPVVVYIDSLENVSSGRLFVDTRSFLLRELAADFEWYDWAFGRGALGSYYSPYFEMWRYLGLPGDSANRQQIEVGFLQLTLKSGVLAPLLYLLVAVAAVWRSRFIADRRLATGCCIVIASHIIAMAGINAFAVDLRTFIAWSAIGFCLFGERRGMS